MTERKRSRPGSTSTWWSFISLGRKQLLNEVDQYYPVPPGDGLNPTPAFVNRSPDVAGIAFRLAGQSRRAGRPTAPKNKHSRGLFDQRHLCGAVDGAAV